MIRRGAVIAGLIGAAVALLMIVGLIVPKAAQVRARQKQVATAEEQQATLQLQLEQLQADAQRATQARKQLVILQTQVPPTADLPGIIRLLNDAANQSAVDFMSLTPGQPTASADSTVSVISTQITVTGGFFSVDEFLYRLETLPRINTVQSVSVAAGPEGYPQLQVDITTQFYTSDTSAGPGSVPGQQQAPNLTQVPGKLPAPSPSASKGSGG